MQDSVRVPLLRPYFTLSLRLRVPNLIVVVRVLVCILHAYCLYLLFLQRLVLQLRLAQQLPLELLLRPLLRHLHREIVQFLLLLDLRRVVDHHVVLYVELAHVHHQLAPLQRLLEVLSQLVLLVSVDLVAEQLLPPDALLRVHHQHPPQHVLCRRGDAVLLAVYLHRLRLDVLEQLHHRRGHEGRLAEEQLVEAGPDRPDVGFGVVLLVVEHLRSHVERRPQHRGRHIGVGAQQLGEAEVGDLDVAVVLQDVGQFEIAVHDVVPHERLEAVQDLEQIVHCLVLHQRLLLLDVL